MEISFIIFLMAFCLGFFCFCFIGFLCEKTNKSNFRIHLTGETLTICVGRISKAMNVVIFLSEFPQGPVCLQDIEFLGFMVKWVSRGIEGGDADGFLILLGFDLL